MPRAMRYALVAMTMSRRPGPRSHATNSSTDNLGVPRTPSPRSITRLAARNAMNQSVDRTNSGQPLGEGRGFLEQPACS